MKIYIFLILTITQLFAVTYDYDELNRLTKATYADGIVMHYSYDDGGNLLSVVSEGISIQDADGDGIPDDVESRLGLDPNSADSDGDGISDMDEVGDINHPRDSDGDGTIDAMDLDSDNDGVSDAHEREAGTDPTDSHDKPVVKRVELAPIDDVVLPKNGSTHMQLGIVNTTGEVTNIDTRSYNTDLVVTSDTNPMEITAVHNAKGQTKVKVTASAGGKSDSEVFNVYIGVKPPKKFVPIMMDDITTMVPIDQ